MAKSNEKYLAEVNALFGGNLDLSDNIIESKLEKYGNKFFVLTNDGSFVDKTGHIVMSKDKAVNFKDQKSAIVYMKKLGISIDPIRENIGITEELEGSEDDYVALDESNEGSAEASIKEEIELSELSGGVQREDPPRMVSAWKKRAIDRIKRDEEKITAVLMNDMDRKPKSVKLVRNRKEEEDTDVYFDIKINNKVIGGISSGYPHEDWSFGPEDSMQSYGKLDKPYEAILKAATKTLGYKTRSRGYDEAMEESKKDWIIDKVMKSDRSDVLLVGTNTLKGGEKFYWEVQVKDIDPSRYDFSHAKFDKDVSKSLVYKIKKIMKEDVDFSLEDLDEANGGSTVASIKALRDTDYRDSSAYFKMVQLLKGVAAVAENDKMADKFLSAVSDALTSAARKVLPGTGDGEDDPKAESRGTLGDSLLAFAQGKKKINESVGPHVPDAFKTVQVGSTISYDIKAFPRIKGAPVFQVTKVDARRRTIYGVDKSGRPVELEYDGGASDMYTLRIQGDVSKKMKPAFAIKPFAIRVEDID